MKDLGLGFYVGLVGMLLLAVVAHVSQTEVLYGIAFAALCFTIYEFAKTRFD